VPIEDLVGVISLSVQIPTLGKGTPDFIVRKAKKCQINILVFLTTCTQTGFLKTLVLSVILFFIDSQIVEPKMSASFVPDHKASMVLFLDRVYGIDNQDFLLHVLEVGFLPDMRAAASLDTVSP